MSETKELQDLRVEIDKIDHELVNALVRRAEVVTRVKKAKKRGNIDIYSPAREMAIIERARKLAAGGYFPDESIDVIFREVISATRSLIGELRVAYLSPKQSLSYSAAQKQFGECVSLVEARTIEKAFEAVEKDDVNYAVVPIEISRAGLLTGTVEQFMSSSLGIVAEVQVSRDLVLLGSASGFDAIKRVYSDSISFEQTVAWMEQNLPNVEKVLVDDCFLAAEQSKLEDDTAVIGPEELSADGSLKVLAKLLGQDAALSARFFVAGKTTAQATGADKTSLIIAVQDKSGALYELLSPFARHNVTMTKIESKPMRNRSGEYIFFIDIDGHHQDENVASALKEVEPYCSYLRVLGSYPLVRGL